MIPPRHFIRFLDGRAERSIVVGLLPGHIGCFLGTLETEIRLEITYARKLRKRRINYEEFSEIQSTIDNGFCLRENQYQLSFFYIKDQVIPKIYFLLIKTDKSRRELWLVTFHRLKRKQFSKRLERDRILLGHVEDEFMG